MSTGLCHNSNFHRRRRENAVRLSFMCDKASLWLILENNLAHPKNMSKLILTDYINVANRGTNVKTGHQPIWVTLSYKSDLESDNESSFRKEHLKSEGFVVVQLKGTKTVLHYIVRVENYPWLRAKLKLSILEFKKTYRKRATRWNDLSFQSISRH